MLYRLATIPKVLKMELLGLAELLRQLWPVVSILIPQYILLFN